jgi:hypothetical protein
VGEGRAISVNLLSFDPNAFNLFCRGELPMTIRVDLNPEIEARLIAQAKSEGVPLERLAERLLKQALTERTLSDGVLTVEEFHNMLAGMAEGSEKLPNLPTESFSRDSFYEDRLDGRDAVPPR